MRRGTHTIFTRRPLASVTYFTLRLPLPPGEGVSPAPAAVAAARRVLAMACICDFSARTCAVGEEG